MNLTLRGTSARCLALPVPQCLYEQFRRVANQYFLLVSIISLTPVSPVTPVTNVVPLIAVLSASLLKEKIEDSNRKKKDREMNATLIKVLGVNGWQELPWSQVMVGDVGEQMAPW